MRRRFGVTLMKAEGNSANAQHHGMLASLRRTVNMWEDRMRTLAGSLLKLRELFDQGRKVDVPTHTAKLAEIKTKVVLTNDLSVKRLVLHKLPHLVGETVRL